MNYDPIRAMLAATSEELGRLLEVAIPEARDDSHSTDVPVTHAADPELLAEWGEANMMLGDRLHPTIVGMVGVLSRPTRSVLVERFSRNLVIPLFVAWDDRGRATLTDGIPGGDLLVEATSFDLLPPLLLHTLHVHRGIPAPDRQPVTTNAARLEQILGGEAPDAGGGGEAAADPLAPILADLRFAWRASGSWPGEEVDTSVTALSAGATGLWTVTHDAQDRAEPPSPDTEVTLTPSNAAELAAKLGDVVTGRVAVPDFQRASTVSR